MSNWIKQGDAYAIPVSIKLNGEYVNVADIDTVEFYVGDTRKLYPGDVRYSAVDGCFYIPLSQAETFGFPADDAVAVDARVKFSGGDIMGVKAKQYIPVYDATSEVEI